jgi:hypothetical protein
MYAVDMDRIAKIMFENGMQLTYAQTDTQDSRDNPDVPNSRDTDRHYPPPAKEIPVKEAPANTEIRKPDPLPDQTGDLLFLKDGQLRPVILLEITPEIVKYLDFDNPSGPVYSIYKSDVMQIRLQNGKMERYTETEKPDSRNEIAAQYPDRHKKYSIREDDVLPETALPSRKRFRFGIRGGVNVSTFSGMEETFDRINESQGREMKNGNKTGFHAGLTVQVNLLSNVLFLQPELLLSLQGSERKEEENSYTNDLYYLQLPLPLVCKINLTASTGLILGAGPYLAYGIYGSGKAFDEEIEKSDYGFTFLGGFQIGNIRISGAYDLGLYEVINAKNWEITGGMEGIPEIRTRNLKISLGYFF